MTLGVIRSTSTNRVVIHDIRSALFTNRVVIHDIRSALFTNRVVIYNIRVIRPTSELPTQ